MSIYQIFAEAVALFEFFKNTEAAGVWVNQHDDELIRVRWTWVCDGEFCSRLVEVPAIYLETMSLEEAIQKVESE